MKEVLIAPSTDPCAVKDLTKYAKEMEKAGADWLHCDIMDGKFVPKRTFDYLILAFIRKSTNLKLDVHLMVENPMKVAKDYVKYGADSVTFHYESFKDKIQLVNAVQTLKRLGVKVGVAIKPSTPVNALEHILKYLDIVLVMSVEPGKSGQQFIKESLVKIAFLNKKRQDEGYNFLIEVDGGINLINASIVAISGADVLVSGNTIFKSTDRKRTISDLRGEFDINKD